MGAICFTIKHFSQVIFKEANISATPLSFKMDLFQSSLTVWFLAIRNTFLHVFSIRNHDLVPTRV